MKKDMTGQGSIAQCTAESELRRYPSNTKGFLFFLGERVLKAKATAYMLLAPGPRALYLQLWELAILSVKSHCLFPSPRNSTGERLIPITLTLCEGGCILCALSPYHDVLGLLDLLFRPPEFHSPCALYGSQIRCHSKGNPELHNTKGLLCLASWSVALWLAQPSACYVVSPQLFKNRLMTVWRRSFICMVFFSNFKALLTYATLSKKALRDWYFIILNFIWGNEGSI